MEFTDLEFDKAVKETKFPNLDGWTLFTETKDVKIYRFHRKVSLFNNKVVIAVLQ